MMNWEQIERHWELVKGHVKHQWSMLNEHDLASLPARKDALIHKLQERYGVRRDEAEKEVADWLFHLPSRAKRSPSAAELP